MSENWWAGMIPFFPVESCGTWIYNLPFLANAGNAGQSWTTSTSTSVVSTPSGANIEYTTTSYVSHVVPPVPRCSIAAESLTIKQIPGGLVGAMDALVELLAASYSGLLSMQASVTWTLTWWGFEVAVVFTAASEYRGTVFNPLPRETVNYVSWDLKVPTPPRYNQTDTFGSSTSGQHGITGTYTYPDWGAASVPLDGALVSHPTDIIATIDDLFGTISLITSGPPE